MTLQVETMGSVIIRIFSYDYKKTTSEEKGTQVNLRENGVEAIKAIV